MHSENIQLDKFDWTIYQWEWPLSGEHLDVLFICHDYQNLYAMVVIFITLKYLYS